jgi:hypothetical protein
MRAAKTQIVILKKFLDMKPSRPFEDYLALMARSVPHSPATAPTAKLRISPGIVLESSKRAAKWRGSLLPSFLFAGGGAGGNLAQVARVNWGNSRWTSG